MEKPEQMIRLVMLEDFYGPLLTDKQQMVLNLYCENDWSLSEIADHIGVTRQAVYDLLKRAENSLEGYEKRLGLVIKFIETREQLEEVYEVLTKNHNLDKDTITGVVNKLRGIIDAVY